MRTGNWSCRVLTQGRVLSKVEGLGRGCLFSGTGGCVYFPLSSLSIAASIYLRHAVLGSPG